MKKRVFDAIVIGAGPAGELAAGLLGEKGLATALVESHLIGGECSYYACMPSKALLRPAEALAEARRIPGASEAADGALDAEAVLRRRDDVVHALDDSSQLPWLDERNVTLVRGHGWLEGERRVRVGDDLLVARRAVVVAVGTGSLMPAIPGLAEAAPWTNREGTTAKAVPGRLLVLGAGVVGVELAQAWATLGSGVTLIELFERVLVREEPFASEEVEVALRDLGVDVRTNAKTLLQDGRVLVAGGGPLFGSRPSPVSAAAELYDPATNTWSATGSLRTARWAHEAVLLGDGRVLVVGGLDANGTTLASAEVYDPGTGSWMQVASMNVPRHGHKATRLADGRVLVAAGDPDAPSAEIFDPAAGTWTPTANMVVHRAPSGEPFMSLLADGRVLVAGGAPAGSSGEALASAELFTP